MRTENVSIKSDGKYAGSANITYPDRVVFVFNPLYVNFARTGESNTIPFPTSLKFSVKGTTLSGEKEYEMDCKLYNGGTRIYMSRLLELFFDDVRWKRSLDLTVTIKAYNEVVWSQSFIAIWGNISVGERFSYYGAFNYDRKKPYLERRRIWFKNFPFTVSMFAHTGASEDKAIQARYDGMPYDENQFVHYPLIFSIFDSVEDEECGTINDFTEGVNLEGAAFVRSENKFYGCSDENNVYEDWTANPPYVYGPEAYNKNGVARTDMVWATMTGRLVRYDSELQDLVEIPYGRSYEVGIFEVCPSITFPNAVKSVTYKQKGVSTNDKTSVFDTTFDYTFFVSGEYSTITKLIIDNRTNGHYLRWIDRCGMYQYYLFDKGKKTVKNKLGSNTVIEDYSVGGLYFANHERTTHIEATTTVKCCAPLLEEDIFDYVSSIIASPIIDLYVGKTKAGTEIWVPVNIVASSIDYDNKQCLHDLEISFTLPPTNAQSL